MGLRPIGVNKCNVQPAQAVVPFMHKRREAGLEQSTSASAWVDVRVRYDDCDAARP